MADMKPAADIKAGDVINFCGPHNYRYTAVSDAYRATHTIPRKDRPAITRRFVQIDTVREDGVFETVTAAYAGELAYVYR